MSISRFSEFGICDFMEEMTKVWLYRGKVYCRVSFSDSTYLVNVRGIKKVGR